MGLYATDGLLRAIAEVEGVNIVGIDTAALQEMGTLYIQHCPGRVMPIRMPWAQEIVPKLERQRMGKKIEAPNRASPESFVRKCSGWRLRPAKGLKGRAHHVMTSRG